MAIFGDLFGHRNGKNQKMDSTLPWIMLTSVDQLDAIVAASHEKPQLIFKHSTSCAISRMVLGMFGEAFDLDTEQLDLHFLDLLRYRSISNAIAEKFGVVHESPQLLVVRDGSVTVHASHGRIVDMDLSEVFS